METQTPNPPSSTTREPLVSSPGSREPGRNKGKQFDSVTKAHKSEIETVLLLMETCAVDDGFIHELSGVPMEFLGPTLSNSAEISLTVPVP